MPIFEQNENIEPKEFRRQQNELNAKMIRRVERELAELAALEESYNG